MTAAAAVLYRSDNLLSAASCLFITCAWQELTANILPSQIYLSIYILSQYIRQQFTGEDEATKRAPS